MMNSYPEGQFCFLHHERGRVVTLVSQWSHAESWRATNTKCHYLFATAAHVPRNQLRDLVSAKRAARVKGNLAPEFADGANARHWKQINDTKQRYPRDLRTRQAPCLPFRAGSNMLPGAWEWLRAQKR